MSRSYLAGGFLCGSLSMILFTSPTLAQAEKDKADKVKFETGDGVELHGFFYPGSKGKDAPCVLMLHKLVKGKKEKWDKLATAIQKKGYSVLAFDFRGHGESTSVTPQFWTFKHNLEGVQGYVASDPKKTISHQDFRNTSYYQYLVNDIAAAKLFLDRRNDAGSCNSANLILIGEEDGANLGALWMASEFSLYRAITLPPLQPEKLEATPEGKDIICGIWLSMNQKVPAGKGPTTSVLNWFRDEKIKKVPMAFLFADGDSQGDAFANTAVRSLKVGKHPEDLTAAKSIKKGGKLTGTDLLIETLETEKLIEGYLDNLNSKKTPNEYDKRDVEGNSYVWRFPGTNRSIMAKPAKQKLLAPIPLSQLQK
jgi:hypothetical protein